MNNLLIVLLHCSTYFISRKRLAESIVVKTCIMFGTDLYSISNSVTSPETYTKPE